MKTFIACFLTFAFMAQCSSPRESKLEDLARQRIKLMNDHDPDGLARLFADSATIGSVGFNEPAIGPAGVREAYRRYFTASPDLQYEITNLVKSDQSVVVEYTSTGTMVALEENVPAYMKGKRYTLRNCTRMDIENGKIVREMTYFDQVAFLRQMGFFEQKPD